MNFSFVSMLSRIFFSFKLVSKVFEFPVYLPWICTLWHLRIFYVSVLSFSNSIRDNSLANKKKVQGLLVSSPTFWPQRQISHISDLGKAMLWETLKWVTYSVCRPLDGFGTLPLYDRSSSLLSNNSEHETTTQNSFIKGYISITLTRAPNRPSMASTSTRSFFFTQNSCSRSNEKMGHRQTVLDVKSQGRTGSADWWTYSRMPSSVFPKIESRRQEKIHCFSPTSATLLTAKKTVPAITRTSPSSGFEPPEHRRWKILNLVIYKNFYHPIIGHKTMRDETKSRSLQRQLFLFRQCNFIDIIRSGERNLEKQKFTSSARPSIGEHHQSKA